MELGYYQICKKKIAKSLTIFAWILLNFVRQLFWAFTAILSRPLFALPEWIPYVSRWKGCFFFRWRMYNFLKSCKEVRLAIQNVLCAYSWLSRACCNGPWWRMNLWYGQKGRNKVSENSTNDGQKSSTTGKLHQLKAIVDALHTRRIHFYLVRDDKTVPIRPLL